MTEQLPETYFSVDVETAGPNPGNYALLSIGACLAFETRQTFYCELRPDLMVIDSESVSVHGLTLDRLVQNGTPPADALRRFADWVQEQTPAGTTPILVAFNAVFDWMFLNDYFYRYLGFNPFGHSALDIKALYMGLRRLQTYRGLKPSLNAEFPPGRELTHNALDDAIDQAVLFQQIYAAMTAKGA